jgi:uncharacterized membrane protein (UPF0127 family)
VPDPLLDKPAGAPKWLPSVDDERGLRWLGVAVAIALVGGLLSFVVRGADRPADPLLGSTTTTADGNTVELIPLDGFGEVAIKVTAPDGKVLSFCVLHATTPEQRQRGLMTVTDLRGYTGMAFSYDADTTVGYYMRNTPLPLSIAYVAADGALVSTADMAPCEDREGCQSYPPAGAFRHAVEVPQGYFPDMGIAPGARIEVGGPCPA